MAWNAGDPFSLYINRLDDTLNKIGQDHSIYTELLNLKNQLSENIYEVKRFNDDENRRSRRNEIIDRLNEVFLSEFGEPFITIAHTPTTVQLSLNFPPGSLDSFVGRDDVIKVTKKLLVRGKTKIIAFCGMGGIGKSTLAKKILEINQKMFPGGTLWADFSAHQGDVLPIIFSWAQLLNHPEINNIPSPQIRAQALGKLIYEYTEKVGNILAVFDDVRETQEDPWLSNAHLLRTALPNNVPIIITSRQTEVAQSFRAKIINLDVLRTEDAVRLLLDRLEDIEVDFGTCIKLVESVGNLPLATEILAGMIQGEGLDWTISKVTDTYDRINSLHAGDLKSKADNVYMSFEISYTGLKDNQKKLFRILGIFAPGYIEKEWLENILGSGFQVDEILRQLCNRGLLWRDNNRFRLHPLLKDFARSLINEDDMLEELSLKHKEYFRLLVLNRPEDFELISKAIGNIITAEMLTFETGKWNEVIDFVLNLAVFGRYLYVRGLWVDATRLIEHGVIASESLGKQTELALFLRELGTLQRELGEYDKSLDSFTKASDICMDIGDNYGLASSLFGKGYVYLYLPDYGVARTILNEAAIIAEASGNEMALGEALRGLGRIEISTGNLQEAERILLKSGKILAKIGNYQGLAYNYRGLGEIFTLRNEIEQSLDLYNKGLLLAQQNSDPQAEAYVLRGIGDAHKKKGNPEDALIAYRKSETLYRLVGDRAALAGTICSIGDVILVGSNLSDSKLREAKRYYVESEKISSMVGQLRWQARSILGRAKILDLSGKREEAIKLGRKAQKLLQEINHRDVKLVDEWLGQVGQTKDEMD